MFRFLKLLWPSVLARIPPTALLRILDSERKTKYRSIRWTEDQFNIFNVRRELNIFTVKAKEPLEGRDQRYRKKVVVLGFYGDWEGWDPESRCSV